MNLHDSIALANAMLAYEYQKGYMRLPIPCSPEVDHLPGKRLWIIYPGMQLRETTEEYLCPYFSDALWVRGGHYFRGDVLTTLYMDQIPDKVDSSVRLVLTFFKTNCKWFDRGVSCGFVHDQLKPRIQETITSVRRIIG